MARVLCRRKKAGIARSCNGNPVSLRWESRRQSDMNDRDTSDPSGGLLWLLEATCLIRYRGPVYLASSLFTVAGAVGLVLSVWLFGLEDHPFFDKILAYEVSVSTIYLSFKLINLRLRAPTFLAMIAEASETWAEMLTDQRNHPILATQRVRVVKVLRWLMILYLLPTTMSVITTTLHNLLSPPDQAQLIIKVWDPVRDSLGPDWIFLRNAWLGTVATCVMTLFGVASCAVMFPCLMAAVQMRVLISALLRAEVLTAARLHQRNLRLVGQINDLFTSSMTIELLGNAIVLSLRAYTFITLLKKGDPRFIDELIFLLTIFADPFVLCYSGQIITDMSEEVYRSSYQSTWYDLPLADQRSLALLMCRASVPLQLQYRNLMSFNMVRYSSVFQGAYSYITALVNM